MFEDFKEKFINMVTSRVFVLILLMAAIASVVVHRMFDLQIVHGEEYLSSFQTRIMRERTIRGSRGNIYDRNGNLLAYNELAHSVTIEDVYESGKMKDYRLNSTIYSLIRMIEGNGDSIVSDFKIILDKNNRYVFAVEGSQLLRFLADVYGYASTDKLSEKERTSTAQEVVDYLCGWNRFRIGIYSSEDTEDTFTAGQGYSRDEVLKILTIRYDMHNNSYQKFIATTVATDVSEKTVAVVMENSNELEGVSIVEDTIRRYIDSVYFSQIIGYTGKVSQEELTALQEENGQDAYDSSDTVGKLGIEKSMENWLQGTKGSETIFVNSVGKVIETTNYVEPVAGNDVYLSIDKDLQIAAYRILEERLASILYTNIINAREFNPENASASNIRIPIYDVYYALINNDVIDIDHFGESGAGAVEGEVYERFLSRRDEVFDTLHTELFETCTPYEKLITEYQAYQSFIVEMLYNNGVLVRDLVDTKDSTYIAWTREEVISLKEFLDYCIAANWIDVGKLDLESQYSDSQEIFNKIVQYVFEQLQENEDFAKRIYRYMIKDDTVTGRQICQILLEQDIVDVEDEEQNDLQNGSISPYTFMMNRIKNIDITPAQLALDPYSASMVITDVNTGEVLALVSYPGYDNNKMANGVDAEYFARLLSDQSRPMNNYATMQRTAPGSTFKMVSATAGFKEGVIDRQTTFTCKGIFDLVTPPPSCWNKSGHGSLNVIGGIEHSCNVFFYELGYHLGALDGTYSDDDGLEKLAYYADMYGLSDTSGVEIEEYSPIVSDTDAVRSAIGQGSNSYTTVGLARYVTTVANSGTCYDLTLINRITDHSGNLLLQNQANVRNKVELEASQWDAIHTGMRKVIQSKAYYNDLKVEVAGKTGTAEESAVRANHALFVCYAPYDTPEIAIATRIANGYTSNYAAQTTKDVLQYYFGLAKEDEIITGTAQQMSGSTAVTD